MKIHVFDTYVWAKNGTRLHFDVFLPEQDEAKALAAARAWLAEIGESEAELTQEECRFCHSEMATPDVSTTIKEKGCFIFQMEACPQPMC